MHKNARLTPLGRAELVRGIVAEGRRPGDVAAEMGLSERTARKWLKRFETEGKAGLEDRSSRPARLRCPTSTAIVARIVALRRRRRAGFQIAQEVGVSPATVSRVLRRAGLSRLSDLEPARPVRRYQRDRPGELPHLDIKKLGRFSRIGHRITGDRSRQSNPRANGTALGWEYVHVAIDDASRIAFSQIKADEKAVSAIAVLKAAVAYYASLGIRIDRVMTDNGSCYKSFAFRDALKALGIRHIRTRPYSPQTNGKAERFIQTALREWAYARAYNTSAQREKHLPHRLHHYNWHRPHGALKYQTPISSIASDQNNLLRLHN